MSELESIWDAITDIDFLVDQINIYAGRAYCDATDERYRGQLDKDFGKLFDHIDKYKDERKKIVSILRKMEA